MNVKLLEKLRVFLFAELCVSCVKYLVNRKLLNLKRFCSFREH